MLTVLTHCRPSPSQLPSFAEHEAFFVRDERVENACVDLCFEIETRIVKLLLKYLWLDFFFVWGLAKICL